MSQNLIFATDNKKISRIAPQKAEIFARTQVKVAGGYLKKQKSYGFFDLREGGQNKARPLYAVLTSLSD